MLNSADHKDNPVNLEEVLSVKIIREHTKTDDNPSLTDELLLTYRKASIEAAENYTGRIWSGNRIYTQSIDTPRRKRRIRAEYTVKLDNPTLDGLVSIYGGGLQKTIQINIAPGDTKIKVPLINETVFDCCHPCGNRENFGLKAMYRVGINCSSDIPSGIVLGCLKYIAWTIMNRGDELVTMRNNTSTQVNGISGTNNAAWASGAIEEWRAYRK